MGHELLKVFHDQHKPLKSTKLNEKGVRVNVITLDNKSNEL